MSVFLIADHYGRFSGKDQMLYLLDLTEPAATIHTADFAYTSSLLSSVYLHARGRGISAHKHADLLLVGEQGSDSFLMCGSVVGRWCSPPRYDRPTAKSTLRGQAIVDNLPRNKHVRNQFGQKRLIFT